MIISRVTELIKDTPMIRLNAIDFGGNNNFIYAKLEYLNPGGSVKDRLGSYLLTTAMQKGIINSESVIIEPTAGNTGIGIALAALQWSLPTIFIVPEKFSVEKQLLMLALGAEIVHTPTSEGINGAINKARELQAEIPNSYLPLQFENEENPACYYASLGPEIYNELDGKIDSFVAGIGSGGTFTGVSRYLQEKLANIRLVGVEPEGSILNGGEAHAHDIEGIGVEFVPPFLKDINISQFYTIADAEGFYFTKVLASEYGLLVGSSSGAALAAAIEESRKLPDNSNIVTIFPDAGDRYLSKNLYTYTKKRS